MVFMAAVQFVIFLLVVLFFKERPEMASDNEDEEEGSTLVDNQTQTNQ